MTLTGPQKLARNALAESLLASDPAGGYMAAVKRAARMIKEGALTAARAPQPAAAMPPLNTEDVGELGAAWFNAQARTGHESPFWQVPAA